MVKEVESPHPCLCLLGWLRYHPAALHPKDLCPGGALVLGVHMCFVVPGFRQRRHLHRTERKASQNPHCLVWCPGIQALAGGQNISIGVSRCFFVCFYFCFSVLDFALLGECLVSFPVTSPRLSS